MNFFVKILFFIVSVSQGFGCCFAQETVDDFQKKELSVIMLYAEELRKNGLSNEVIVKECSELLLKDLACQDKPEPAVSEKNCYTLGLLQLVL